MGRLSVPLCSTRPVPVSPVTVPPTVCRPTWAGLELAPADTTGAPVLASLPRAVDVRVSVPGAVAVKIHVNATAGWPATTVAGAPVGPDLRTTPAVLAGSAVG